jgi:CRP/FNR family transcriptional regulator, polysaccharide utilization system transcription regulator
MDTPCFESRFGLVSNDADVLLFDAGESIFTVGEPIRGVYCLRSGKVGVYTPGRCGEQLPLYVAMPGDVLGLPEVLGNEHFQCMAVALEPVEACFVGREAFLQFYRSRADSSLVLMRQICRRIDMVENGL